MADRGRRFQPGALAWVPDRGPGYRQNLPSKAFTKHNRVKFPGLLNIRRWIFVREELDDFRKGCQQRRSLVTQRPKEAFLPEIHHQAPRRAPEKRWKELSKEAALLSKLSPSQRARKAFVENMEAHLARHPLTVYPHLEEALPTELLLKVLEVLDPERKLEDTWAYCQDGRKITESMKLLEISSTLSCLGLTKKTPVSHSSEWLFEEKPSGTDLLRKDSPPLHENVRKGVSDFCQWATSIGSSPIDEEFICKQFAIDYQNRESCDAMNPLQPKNKVRPNKLQKAELVQKPVHERKLQKPQKELPADTHGTVAFEDSIQSKDYRRPKFFEKIRTEKRVNLNAESSPQESRSSLEA